jgi:hypothetical protein
MNLKLALINYGLRIATENFDTRKIECFSKMIFQKKPFTIKQAKKIESYVEKMKCPLSGRMAQCRSYADCIHKN